MVTKNASKRLEEAIERSAVIPEICDARKFTAPLDSGAVHQGAALEVIPLEQRGRAVVFLQMYGERDLWR